MNKSQQNSFSEVGSALAGVLLAAAYLLAAPYLFAQQGNAVREGSLDGTGDVYTCISVSTSAWTAVPATPLTGRVGFYATVRSTATSAMNMISGTASAPSTAINIEAIVLKVGVTQYHGWSDKKYSYFRSKNATAEDVCVGEVN